MLSERLMLTLPAEARSRTPDRMDSSGTICPELDQQLRVRTGLIERQPLGEFSLSWRELSRA